MTKELEPNCGNPLCKFKCRLQDHIENPASMIEPAYAVEEFSECPRLDQLVSENEDLIEESRKILEKRGEDWINDLLGDESDQP
jgi:hypothetical protein